MTDPFETRSATMTATTQATSAVTRPRFGLLDPATYLTSAHLMADLVVGTATFAVTVTLLAVSAGLMITLVGIPLLAGTLLVARCIGGLERLRAHVLGVVTGAPAHDGRGLRARLVDPADWRAVLYALLLFPAGVVTGTITLTGWACAVAAITSPFYVGRFDDSTRQFGGINLAGPVAGVASVVLGIALLAAMPAIVRRLAGLDALLVHRLLGGHPR
jgi:hypothetical protein